MKFLVTKSDGWALVEVIKQLLDLASAKAKVLFVVFGGSLTLVIWNWFAPVTVSALQKEVSDVAFVVCIFSGGALIFLALWNAGAFIWSEWVGPWRSRRVGKKAETQRRQQLLVLSLEELIIMSLWLAYDARENYIANPNDPLIVSLEKKGLIRATFAGKLYKATSMTDSILRPTPPPNYEIPEPVWKTMRGMPELRINDPEGLKAAVDQKRSPDALKPFLSSLHPAASD